MQCSSAGPQCGFKESTYKQSKKQTEDTKFSPLRTTWCYAIMLQCILGQTTVSKTLMLPLNKNVF
jgi:hypothetical protein